MTVYEAIRTRRSIRRYTEEPLTDQQVKTLLEAAMATPSACDCRPWEFVVVRDKKNLEELAACGKYTGMAKDAGAVIVICATPERQNEICPGYFPQDCGAVAMNIWLQATDLGLGAVWCGVYPGEELANRIAKCVGTPEGVIPFGLICVGHPAEKPEPRDRYEEQRVHKERW
ncbi:MAG: nitroreductase family protein [Clostridia bacterium]|nr:nitroreductase family protein [Clostridia bacterium]MBQ6000143.1 nitroreductase family protein [Clostridia bacterium]